MHLIIGGAWQGKLEYAEQKFNLKPTEIFECSASTDLDLNKRCIYRYEQYLRACSDAGVPPYTDFAEDCIIICQDIFCGIVSADPKERIWRELAGRTITTMAAKASSVTRIFCGMPLKLK